MQTRSRLPSPYRPELEVAHALLRDATSVLDWSRVIQTATPWVDAVRDHPPPFWAMETLLKEYPISSHEGRALMRLAEALLRVPDAETAIALTADQLADAHFDPQSDSALARLSSAALGMSQRLLDPEGGLLQRMGAHVVVQAALRAVQLLGRQFVLGEDIAAALKRSHAMRVRQPALSFSFDMLGEGARTMEDAFRHLDDYRAALDAIADARDPRTAPNGISVKLSALHPRYEPLQHERVMKELVPRVWTLCELAAGAGLHLTIDAEESERLELSLHVFDALCAKIALHHPNWRGFGIALQAYQTRALDLLAEVIAIARRHRLHLMCRLVKGAYWDAEIKRAQEMGLPAYPVFTHKHHTDIAYLACADAMLQASDCLYPQFATHNAATIAAVIQMGQGRSFELGRLHGMGEGIYREVLKDANVRCRVYAPVGRHRDLLAYLVRRLLENGANSSFVHQLHQASIPAAELLASPLHVAPASALPLPRDLFGASRINSEGIDLAVPELRAPLQLALDVLRLPSPALTSRDTIAPSVATANAAFGDWRLTPPEMRCAMLVRTADAMQAQMPMLSAALVREAFKTWNDAIAEVREAIDYLRYYATEAGRILQPQPLPGPTGESNTLLLRGRGAWVCISPWNFPLAIFTGQVAAALVTGNTVLAKPAEQTPAIATLAVQLLHEAGVPGNVLQLLPGDGETVGAALVAQPGIAGVAFTGSTSVAKAIQRALADKDGPIVPLIAETGGINAMLVDSTALPEQVCDAVMQSVFRSAGQRCSSLRVLCVHEAIANEVLAMIDGALAELKLGDPCDWTTDVGPVIDTCAHQRLLEQLHALGAVPPAATSAMSNLLEPRIIEVSRLAAVREEIFGPVLQVMRWRGDPAQVIADINALGYGLTLGLQTRIDGRAESLARLALVGNVYVNRGMTGAVVGVQPFGGEGLSGTGPKAGGPHYLLRFCAEQTVTINTAAAGGNVELMTG